MVDGGLLVQRGLLYLLYHELGCPLEVLLHSRCHCQLGQAVSAQLKTSGSSELTLRHKQQVRKDADQQCTQDLRLNPKLSLWTGTCMVVTTSGAFRKPCPTL